jgi:hypothetical protein
MHEYISKVIRTKSRSENRRERSDKTPRPDQATRRTTEERSQSPEQFRVFPTGCNGVFTFIEHGDASDLHFPADVDRKSCTWITSRITQAAVRAEILATSFAHVF